MEKNTNRTCKVSKVITNKKTGESHEECSFFFSRLEKSDTVESGFQILAETLFNGGPEYYRNNEEKLIIEIYEDDKLVDSLCKDGEEYSRERSLSYRWMFDEVEREEERQIEREIELGMLEMQHYLM